MSDVQADQGRINAAGQLPLTLPPGTRIPGQPRRVWLAWSAAERLEIEMNDAIGSYSTGRYVEVPA